MEKNKNDVDSAVDNFTKCGFKTLIEATKSSNMLPEEENWNYYKVHDSFNNIMNNEAEKILRLMNDILRTQHIDINIRNRDIEEKSEMLVEANDDILEKVANGIDELNGIKKNTQDAIEIQAVSAKLPINGSWNRATFSVSSSLDKGDNNKEESTVSIRLLTAKNIVRPQSFFKDKIDNRNCAPWVPRITEKPNSKKPLALFLEESEYGEQFSHPYEFELERFEPLQQQLRKTTPQQPKPLDETPLIEITTPETLEALVDELRKHSEFSVDLEHHSYRTFMGITCLMQISTTEKDYLIDTLVLRDKLCVLNEVFTKPTIVKIFHGADSDVEWLQRDLSLYVVNMFDTHRAAKQLGYAGLSLAYLLDRFCNVVPNKHFQLADWRIRPLPDELKTYARMDTHYLIHIYHMLKNELLNKSNGNDNILKSVIQRSTEVCLKRYIKPTLKEDSHLNFYVKCKRSFDNRQMYALKELYSWRDTIARSEDESTGYVLPNHMLLQMAETLPRETQGILACCNPIPPLVRSSLLELHAIILSARDQPLIKPILKEDTRSRGSVLQFSKLNLENVMHCPHDLSKNSEFRDDLPTLLGDTINNLRENSQAVLNIEKEFSSLSVFNLSKNSIDKMDEKSKEINISFLSPFERYQLVKPFIEEQERIAAQKEQESKLKETPVITTDDRMAALHAHFIRVSKETPQILPLQEETNERVELNHERNSSPNICKKVPKSLVQMGGVKKRKRDTSKDNLSNELHPDHIIPDNELHTTVPNWKRRKNNASNNKSRKRKFNLIEDNLQGPSFIQNPPNSNQNNNSNQDINSDQKLSGKARKRQRWRNIQRKNIEKQKVKVEQKPNVNKTFTPFDYSTVNFKQFHGGARTSLNQQNIKAKFKGKNKNKKQNKNWNKNLTYCRVNTQ